MRIVAVAIIAAALAAAPAPAIDFQPYQSYYVGSWPESVAVGDVTGDGRGDVLLATERDNDPENDFKLFFFRQLPGGALAAPVRLNTGGPGGVLQIAVGGDRGGAVSGLALQQ